MIIQKGEFGTFNIEIKCSGDEAQVLIDTMRTLLQFHDDNSTGGETTTSELILARNKDKMSDLVNALETIMKPVSTIKIW